MIFKRSVVALAAFGLAVSGIAQGLDSLVGKPAPAFRMTDMNGKVHTNASLKGKAVILDFWATWCGPCKAASPTMQSLHTKYAKKGLVVIGANTSERGAAGLAAAAKYPKEHKYTYVFTKNNDAFARKLGVRSLPVFIFIDKKGIVRRVEKRWDGRTFPASFESTVKSLLSG